MADPRGPWLHAWMCDDNKQVAAGRDSRGFFPLHYAAARGNTEAIRALLCAGGADPNAVAGPRGWTALHCAARSVAIYAISRLCNLGCEEEIKDCDGFTAIDVLSCVIGCAPSSGAASADDSDDEGSSSARGRKVGAGQIARLFTWGDGSNLQLGHGDAKDKDEPRKVGSLDCRDVASIALSSVHALVVTREGSAFSWGFGVGGRLGHGDQAELLAPRELAGPWLQGRTVVSVAASDELSAFLLDDGDVYSCGCGQLSPIRVLSHGAIGVKEVAVGNGHYAVLTNDGAVFTWGRGSEGQLGLGNTESRSDPHIVSFFTKDPGKMIRAGAFHTLALTRSGAVYQWGGGKSMPKRVAIAEDYEKPDEGFSLVTCGEKRQHTATFIAAAGNQSAAVSSTGNVHHWTSQSTTTTMLQIGSKAAKKVAVHDGKLAVLTTGGSVVFVPLDSRGGKKKKKKKGSGRVRLPVVLRSVESLAVSPKAFFATVQSTSPMDSGLTEQNTLRRDLASLLEPGALFTDITLRSLDGLTVRAHKVLLSRCKRLVPQLNSGDATIEISAPNVDALRVFLRLVYTGDASAKGLGDEARRLGSELGLSSGEPADRLLSKHLSKVLKSGAFSDVEVFCGANASTSFSLHRAVLGCRCEFFGAMMSSGMAEERSGRVVLREMSAPLLKMLVKFLYRDTHKMKPNRRLEEELELLVLSDQMLLPALGQSCLRALAPRIDSENVISLQDIAEKASQPALRRLCIEFLLRNPSLLFYSGYFEDLSPEAKSELQAVAVQRSEATFAVTNQIFGPQLSIPEPEPEPEPEPAEEIAPVQQPSTTKKKKQKKKKPKKPPATTETAAAPQPATSAVIQPAEDLFWGPDAAPASSVGEKKKRKKKDRTDAIQEDVSVEGETVLLDTGKVLKPQRHGVPQQPKPKSIPAPKRAWASAPASSAPRQTLEEIEREQAAAAAAAAAAKPQPRSSPQSAVATTHTRSPSRPMVVDIGSMLRKPAPEPSTPQRSTAAAAAAAPAWKPLPPATPEQRLSLAEIQRAERAKIVPPTPTRKWEASPVARTRPPEHLADILITEEERKKQASV